MKRKATIGLFILFFFPFIWTAYAIPINGIANINNIIAPPSNDECSNASTLTVNQNYLCNNVTAATLAEATPSGAPHSCNSDTKANEDVWFKFVATDVSHKIELSNIVGNQTDLYHMLYDGGVSGNCPTSEAAIYCSDNETSNISGFTIGNTYIIRVFTNSTITGANTTFNVCVGTQPMVPSNDDCANAEAITSLPFNDMYDASGATNNSGFITATGCETSFDMNDGVWYTITGDGGDITITVSPTGWDAAITVYEGSCSSFTCVDNSNIGTSGVVESVAFTSTLSTVYYVNVGYPSGTIDQPEGIFDLGVTSTTLSIDEIVAKGFYYYPNPVQDVLKMSANESIEQISLYSILGREIKRFTKSALNAEIDLTHLASGTYFVRVFVGESSGSFKIIKN